MKKTLVMLVALIATMTASADNIALNKTTKATSGEAALAVDGNEGTRWESEQGVDPQTWQVDLGSAQEFESIQILWEGAYAKTFTIEAGNDIDADGYLTGGTVIVSKSDVDLAGQMKQTYTLDAPVTARYVKFTGTERATPYGYSFFEFRVLTPSSFPDVPAVSGADVLPIYTAGETSPGYAFYDWGGGTGTTETIGEGSAYKISNFQWFGSQFAQTDVSNKQYAHFDIYPLQDMTLSFVMINRNADDTANDGEKGIQKSLTANQWNAIDIPVQDYLDKGAAMSRLFQIKYVSQVVAEAEGIAENDGFANGDGSETFLIGNVYFYGTRVLDTEAPVLVTAELDKVVDTDVTLKLKATDNNSKVTFVINDGTKDYTVDGTSGEEVTYTISNLQPETYYIFTIIAKDAAGNESPSQTVNATTGAASVVTDATSGEGSYTIPSGLNEGKKLQYSWAYTQTDMDVTVTYTCTNSSEITGIVDGYVFDKVDGFAEREGLSYTWTNCTEGQVITSAHKWMFAGGDFVTPDFTYTVKESQTPTGISNIATTAANRNGKFYDLSGREVRNPQKGIYIIDGIKVVVK